MIILADKQGLFCIIEKSQLTANALNKFGLRPDVSRFEVTWTDQIHTGFDGKCSICKQLWGDVDFNELTRPDGGVSVRGAKEVTSSDSIVGLKTLGTTMSLEVMKGIPASMSTSRSLTTRASRVSGRPWRIRGRRVSPTTANWVRSSACKAAWELLVT